MFFSSVLLVQSLVSIISSIKEKISETIFLKLFLSSVVQKYAKTTEFAFNIICNIVIITVKCRFHVSKVFKIDLISASGRSFS